MLGNDELRFSMVPDCIPFPYPREMPSCSLYFVLVKKEER